MRPMFDQVNREELQRDHERGPGAEELVDCFKLGASATASGKGEAQLYH